MRRGIYEKTDSYRNRSSSGFYIQKLCSIYHKEIRMPSFLPRTIAIIVEPVTNTPLSTPHIVIVPQLEPLAMLRSALRSSGKRSYALYSTDSALCNAIIVSLAFRGPEKIALHSHSTINTWP